MIQYYKNKKSARVVRIIKREGHLIHVMYVATNCKSWFTDNDFDRLFTKVA